MVVRPVREGLFERVDSSNPTVLTVLQSSIFGLGAGRSLRVSGTQEHQSCCQSQEHASVHLDGCRRGCRRRGAEG